MSDAVALLDLLAARGIVAWLAADAAGAPVGGSVLVVDSSGVDGVARVLVARGFAVTDQDLPAHVVFAHPRHGRVVLLPVAHDVDGDATWHPADERAPVTLPAAAFDPVAAVPRRVRLPTGVEFVPMEDDPPAVGA